MKKYMALGASLAALGAAGAAIGQTAAAGGAAASQADGGLSMLPVVVEHDAKPGPLATYTIAEPLGYADHGHRHAAPVGAVGGGQGLSEPEGHAALNGSSPSARRRSRSRRAPSRPSTWR